ncbi:hypothetical protein [Burkholderia pyrrocinia]
MKILGAAVSIPVAIDDLQSYSSGYAVSAARLALDQAGCLPSELDLIVSLSISPSRIVDDPAIAGPRLAHPVQRDLRARNAAVFDLLDADWTLALDFAQSHCRWLGYRHALVIRAEALADVEHADSSGFADGAGAIVLTTGNPNRCHVSSYADLGGLALASVDEISARHLDATCPVARFESRFDVATGRFDAERSEFSPAVRTVVDEVCNRTIRPVTMLFHESWLGAAISINDGVDHVEGARDIPNPFQLPAWLAGCVAESRGARDAEHTVAALTLDVFRQRVACSTMEV